MALLVITTRRSGQDAISFWGMCNIPTKWYPLCLILLFSLLGSDPISLLAGAAVGYAFESGRCAALHLSDARLQGWDVKIQSSATLSPVYYAPAYVPHLSAQLPPAAPLAFSPRQTQNAAAPASFMDRFRVRGADPAPAAASPAAASSDPFAGPGHSLR